MIAKLWIWMHLWSGECTNDQSYSERGFLKNSSEWSNVIDIIYHCVSWKVHLYLKVLSHSGARQIFNDTVAHAFFFPILIREALAETFSLHKPNRKPQRANPQSLRTWLCTRGTIDLVINTTNLMAPTHGLESSSDQKTLVHPIFLSFHIKLGLTIQYHSTYFLGHPHMGTFITIQVDKGITSPAWMHCTLWDMDQ